MANLVGEMPKPLMKLSVKPSCVSKTKSNGMSLAAMGWCRCAIMNFFICSNTAEASLFMPFFVLSPLRKGL